MTGALSWLDAMLARSGDRDRIELDRQSIAELRRRIGDTEDALAALGASSARAAGGSELLDADAVARLHSGASPVRVFREARRMSVAELAAAAGADPAAIEDIEARRVDPGFDAMRRIAAALSVDLDDLVPWTQD